MQDNPSFLIERCSDGQYVIETEDGSRSWTAHNELGGKAWSLSSGWKIEKWFR
jgi:hypothetical protein